VAEAVPGSYESILEPPKTHDELPERVLKGEEVKANSKYVGSLAAVFTKLLINGEDLRPSPTSLVLPKHRRGKAPTMNRSVVLMVDPTSSSFAIEQ
jgi:hypothetical protein